eukprot:2351750-Amphidinium_carterae.1
MAPSSHSLPRNCETECGDVPLPSDDHDPWKRYRGQKQAQSTVLPEVNPTVDSDVVDHQLKCVPSRFSEGPVKDQRHSIGDLILPV